MSKEIQYLVIHCTATPEGRAVMPDDIRRWHLSENGWKQVGYTDMVLLDGKVERLVGNNEDKIIDPWEITNGVAGINSISRHIVYVGGTDASGKAKDTRTPQQKAALGNYVLDFVRRFRDVQVAGHYQFDGKKACPSFDVPAWCRQIGVTEKNIKA